MTDGEQVSAFEAALNKVIQYHMDEYDMSRASIVGTLEYVKLKYFKDRTDEDDALASDIEDEPEEIE